MASRLLATSGAQLVMIGGAIGVATSLLAARFLATLLYGVGRFDPVSLFLSLSSARRSCSSSRPGWLPVCPRGAPIDRDTAISREL